MQQIFHAIDAAFNSLDEYQREIVQTKYGWRWVNGVMELPPPRKTCDTYKILYEKGYKYGQTKFYEDLHKIRCTVDAYVSALGKSVLQQVSALMPQKPRKVRELTDEEFEKVKEYLKLDQAEQKRSDCGVTTEQ